MPAPADPAALVQRLMAIVHRTSAGESVALMYRSGLTMAQLVALQSLRRADASISELAARLRLSLPATSQLVGKLVAAALVDRSESRADRRVRRVALRPAGRRFLERLNEVRRREISDALGALGPDARDGLRAALARAVAELEDRLDRRFVAVRRSS